MKGWLKWLVIGLRVTLYLLRNRKRWLLGGGESDVVKIIDDLMAIIEGELGKPT